MASSDPPSSASSTGARPSSRSSLWRRLVGPAEPDAPAAAPGAPAKEPEPEPEVEERSHASRNSVWKLLTRPITFGPDIEAPVVKMIYPTDFAVFRPGAKLRVRWESKDNVEVERHRVSLSLDDGITYADVSPDLPGWQKSFTLVVPEVHTTRGRIKVLAADGAGNSAFASSRNPFTIEREPDPPVVKLLAPLGKQVLRAGTTVLISWRAQKGVPPLVVDLALSFDAGSTYHPLARGLPAALRVFRFQVPNVPSQLCRLRVTVRDGAGRSMSDRSDADLTITGPK